MSNSGDTEAKEDLANLWLHPYQPFANLPCTPDLSSPSPFGSVTQPDSQTNGFRSSHLQSQHFAPSHPSNHANAFNAPTSAQAIRPSHFRTANLPVRMDTSLSSHGPGSARQKPAYNTNSGWSFSRADEQPLTPAADSPPQNTNTSPSVSGISVTRPPSSSSETSRRLGSAAMGDALGKRRRDLDADMAAYSRSKRPTPDPSVSGRAPQMSRENSAELDPILNELFGSDVQEDFRGFRQAQMDTERQLDFERQRREEKERQEKEDEEMARKLYEELNGTPVPEQTRPATGRAPPSTQSVFGTNGKVRRPSPPALPPAPVYVPQAAPSTYSTGSFGKAPPAGNTSSQAMRVKKDPEFIRLDSDDDDIQIIDSRPAARHQSHNTSARTLPWPHNNANSTRTTNVPESVDLTNNFPAVGTPNGYGSYYGSSSGGTKLPGINSMGGFHGAVGSSVYNNTMNQLGASSSSGFPGSYNAAYDMLDSQISGFGATPMGFGTNGLSSLTSSVFGQRSGNPNLLGRSNMMPGTFPGSLQARMPWGAEDDDDGEGFVGFGDTSYGYGDYNDQDNSEALKDLLNNIRPDEEVNLGSDDSTGTPEGMADTANLYKYQEKGLAWLSKMEEGSNKGSILADDMGLGKTIQAIALMVSRRSEDNSCKTNLIVAPVALIRQWESEISSKVRPSHKLTTFVYHGTSAEKKKATHAILRSYDVVITTYGALQTDRKKQLQIQKLKKENPNCRPKPTDLPILIGDDCKWYRCILDEAQNIKNKIAKTSLAAYDLKSTYKLVMTGTPMMNSVEELFSLIHFLRIKPYTQWEMFQIDFARPLKKGNGQSRELAMRKMQALCKAIMLRRTKKSEMDGKPLVVLPERRVEVAGAVFEEDEETFYKALETQTQLRFSKFMKAGTVGKHYSNILTLLLRLRQAACHPHLIKDFAVTIDATPEMLKDAAMGLPEESVQRLINNPIADCPVCMDASQNYTIFHPCGHNTCPECFCRLADAAQNQAAANDGNGKAPFACHTCRATIDPSKVTDYVHFKLIHQPELAAAEEGLEGIDGPTEDDVDTDSDSESGSGSEAEESEDEDGDLDGFVVNDDETIEQESDGNDGDDLDEVKPARPTKSKQERKAKKAKAEAKDEDQSGDDYVEDQPGYNRGGDPFEKAGGSKLKKKKKGDPKGKGREKKEKKKNDSKRKTLAQLKKEGMKNKTARRAYMKRLAKDFIPSAKTKKCMDILQTIKDAGEGEKTIVFSQFTSLLDLIEIPINQKGWKYTRFDGSMSANERNAAVQLFTKDPRYQIMLISLKAGNAGLNLTAASQVVILDPFWNPYIEEQAIDRAHRIGQRKPVQIHRVLVENTVEDRIMEIQEKKRSLINGALDEGAAANVGRLGISELSFLFGLRS